MELKSKKIFFCFPYKGAGGVPILFLRLANYLNSNGFIVCLIDYPDGYMALNNKSNIELIEYGENNIRIENNSILVLQAMTPWSIYPMMKIDREVELFFISTIPTNFYPILPGFRDIMSHGKVFAKIIWHTLLLEEFRKIKSFLNSILKNKSLVFLDEDIIANLSNSLDIVLNDYKILPLFSENVQGNLYLENRKKRKDTLVFGWVGRLADFKVHILNKVIFDLKNYSETSNFNIKFVVIGDGDKANQLLNSCTESFVMERINHIRPDILGEKLLTFDLYFAMGTSALDGARFGIPTVRLDYSFKQVLNYKYKFIFDVKGFSLGELIGGDYYNIGNYTIDDIIACLIESREYLSQQTYDYYKYNHSLDVSAQKFIGYLRESTFKWGDLLDQNYDKSILYKLWKKVRELYGTY